MQELESPDICGEQGVFEPQLLPMPPVNTATEMMTEMKENRANTMRDMKENGVLMAALTKKSHPGKLYGLSTRSCEIRLRFSGTTSGRAKQHRFW